MNTHPLLLKFTGAIAAAALVASLFGFAMTASVQQAHAATLAEQIICYVDQQLGPNVPFNPQTDYCNSGEPTEPGEIPQCFDGTDNDGDGLVDLADPGCSGPTDDSETGGGGTGTTTAQCADTTDNDGDSLIDLADPGCANAQDDDEANSTSTPATSTATVSIHKYVEGTQATSGNTGGETFMFSASWDNEGGSGMGSGTFTLGSDNSYHAVTSALNLGSSYSFMETTSDIASSSNTLPAGAQCQDGMWRLMGYRTGTSLSNAESATLSTTSPNLTDIQANQHVIVVNEECDDTGTTTDAALHVDSIDAQKTTAIANDTYADGWRYVFHITTPNDEENLSMRFSDWFVSSSSSSTIPVANNMRVSSAQASSTSPITLTASNVYSTPPMIMTTDLDPSMPGRQVEVLVEVKIPAGTANETYTTNYGVQTLP